jgi:hypothetical protein
MAKPTKPRKRAPKHDPIVIEPCKQKPGKMFGHVIMSPKEFVNMAFRMLDEIDDEPVNEELSTLVRRARLSTLEGSGSDRIDI